MNILNVNNIIFGVGLSMFNISGTYCLLRHIVKLNANTLTKEDTNDLNFLSYGNIVWLNAAIGFIFYKCVVKGEIA